MIIGDRLRVLREETKLSQGDIEKRTGLLRCYVSRVENGHTVPAVETLEKFARALEVPLYHLMYDGEAPPPPLKARAGRKARRDEFGTSGRDARVLDKFRKYLAKVSDRDQQMLLQILQKMARGK
jgi:transcriptional regulator with XRE-family HTH domain